MPIKQEGLGTIAAQQDQGRPSQPIDDVMKFTKCLAQHQLMKRLQQAWHLPPPTAFLGLISFFCSSFSARRPSTSTPTEAPRYCLMKSKAFPGFSGSSYKRTNTFVRA